MAHSEEHGLHLTRSILATAATVDAAMQDVMPWVDPHGDPSELRGKRLCRRSSWLSLSGRC